METTPFLFASRSNWLLLPAVLAALWIAIADIRSLKQRQEQRSRISSLSNALLYLSGAAIALGCLGYFIEMKSSICLQNVLPGSSFVTVICTVTDSADKMRTIADCYMNSASAMMTGLLTSLLIALVWLVLHQYSKRS
ncbi:hypothetical protein JXA02_05280 [candidate division KSB1 bacterium]|nr:hypothetical protein [candidate division KSB1 bacterium]RQW08113.1 MAG: hypothetical protein EH222_06065 [candidate division KSB1 bacterium]